MYHEYNDFMYKIIKKNMKKILKFLEKNSKWLVIFLVGMGLFFIFKLWLVWMEIRERWGWWYIDLSIWWSFDYYWISAWYIAIALLIVSVFLIFLIKNTKNKVKKIQIAFLIFILWIIWKQIFFLVSPDFKFYLTPVISQYKDKEWMVTDIDKYLELIWKYCPYVGDNSLNFMYSKLDMCSQNDKFQTFFNTADEYIKVLEYAKNNDHKLLYDRTYWWVNKFWVEKILEKYNDETFQAYVIKRTSNINILSSLLKYINNKMLIKVLNDEIYKIKFYFENEENYNQNEWYKYLDELDENFMKKIKNIPYINYNIL
jgi:hypothetical protein